MLEVNHPRVTRPVQRRRTRPDRPNRIVGKYTQVNRGTKATILDNTAQLLDVWQPPVVITGKAVTVSKLQCGLPGIPTRGSGGAIYTA